MHTRVPKRQRPFLIVLLHPLLKIAVPAYRLTVSRLRCQTSQLYRHLRRGLCRIALGLRWSHPVT